MCLAFVSQLAFRQGSPVVYEYTEFFLLVSIDVLFPYNYLLDMQVFDHVFSDAAQCNQLELAAVVAYYGRHYSTFCYHSKRSEWIYFDDAKFRTVSELYPIVIFVQLCLRVYVISIICSFLCYSLSCTVHYSLNYKFMPYVSIIIITVIHVRTCTCI